MAILAMPEHGQDARATKSSRAPQNCGSGREPTSEREFRAEPLIIANIKVIVAALRHKEG